MSLIFKFERVEKLSFSLVINLIELIKRNFSKGDIRFRNFFLEV